MSDPRQKLRDLSNRMNNETDEARRREFQRQIQELEREIQQLDRQAAAADYERTLQEAALHKDLYSDPKKKK